MNFLVLPLFFLDPLERIFRGSTEGKYKETILKMRTGTDLDRVCSPYLNSTNRIRSVLNRGENTYLWTCF